MPVIKVKKLHEDATIPYFSTEGSSGADVKAIEDVRIGPREIKMLSLGFAVEIPKGYELQVRPRSGLAAKWGITIINSPGTIDSDYRGEMKVALVNHSHNTFDVRKDDKIAQLVLHKVPNAYYLEVEELGETSRGIGGYGSTGRN